MRKPTILHTEASNGWGGQEIRILNEMLGMKGRGYKVVLATPPDAAIYKKAMGAGIDTVAVKFSKFGYIEGVSGLARVIKERSVSIINTHSSRDSWMGSIAGRLAGARVLRTRHISSPLNKSPFTRLVYGPLCDGIITTGDSIKRQLVKELGLSPKKVRSIPTGIDVGRFASASGGTVRAGLGLTGENIILGTAAVLRSWKGHEYVIGALPEVLREFTGVRLVLAGEGPWRKKVEECIKGLGLEDKVFLLGHREDIPEVVNAFDISLLASYASEGIPQFLLQSMAAGKPVIGTSVGGIPEVVEDGVTGILVPPKDPAAIAEAVRTMLSDRERMARMGEAGRKAVLERHTMDMMLDSLEELYETVLK